ncbi:hypothetical protein V5O48_016212, partial [Marasmius crinis-equi]
LPSLHTIREYDGTYFEQTVHALSRVWDPRKSSIEPPFDPGPSVVFPALSHIELVEFEFDSEDWPPGLWPNRFADALKGRSDRGALLPSVTLKDCEGVEDEHVQELRRTNVKVEVE